ncbi:class I SAM-dependent methyltransferase [Desertihabitans aurantiacus]|uniref:class I SAM-dependent methyltransferase n=1 Tax=Desertihabitans aurantiacus TaxID=2282477 RepID=UPI000DF7EE42|nr:class I SAM-dependent methyltransferase [Desertihabitans aurantiacus]
MSAPAGTSAEFWEEQYADRDPDWVTRPNAALVDTLYGLRQRPGSALELGCGHGGDAVWLAEQGWQVTATDVSATALARTAALAESRRPLGRVRTEQHDLTASLPAGEFDLVYACFFHSTLGIDRDAVLARAAERVRVGGVFVAVDHASSAPWSWTADAGIEFPSPQQTRRSIGLVEGWSPVRVAAVRRLATGPGGQQAEVTDNVVAVRRTRR